MKPTVQYDCMNDECKTITLGTKCMDGISCPKCGSYVNAVPYNPNQKKNSNKISDKALYVRRKIRDELIESCYGLTPDQVETVLRFADEYNKTQQSEIRCFVNIDVDPKVISESLAKEFKRMSKWL